MTENSYQAIPKLQVNPLFMHTEADDKITVSNPKFRDLEIFKITDVLSSKYCFTVMRYYVFESCLEIGKKI